MDLFTAMQAFVATVNTGSMSKAATHLNVSAAMVGQHIAALETRLGTKLLNRTTRRHSLTEFGAVYLETCRDILERVAIADAEAEQQQNHPFGLLKVTAPITFGTAVLMPALVDYRQIAPDVRLDITLTDRTVDMVEEGIDAAFRIGDLNDSSLIARPLIPYRTIICASPEYLKNHGIPEQPSELAHHHCVGFTPSARHPWRLTKDNQSIEVTVPCSIVVNNGQAVRTAACAGLGLAMQPAILLAPDIQAGRLVQLLADWQLPTKQLSLLYYRDRRMAPRLRSFINFAVTTFSTR